jgi:hypothetical protein
MPPLNESRYLDDLAKPKSDDWKRGPRITLDDMISRTGFESVDLHTEARRTGGGNAHGGVQQNNKVFQSSKTKQNEPLRMWFGKFRGQLVVDVMEQNPGYITWAKREVQGFAAKLAAAGLDDDERRVDPDDADQDPDEEYGDIWTVNR